MEKVAHSCVECECVLFLFLDEKRTVSPRVAMDIDDRVYPRHRSHRRIAIGTANIVDRQDAQVQEGSVAVALPGSWPGYIGVSRRISHIGTMVK